MILVIDLHQDISLSHFENFPKITPKQLNNFQLIIGASCALENRRGKITVPKNPLLELIKHLNFYRNWIRINPKPELMLSIEGLYCVKNSQDFFLLDFFRNLGVRIIAPTWDILNSFPENSAFIRRCNQLGIILDISHSPPASAENILSLSSRPIIASHNLSFSVHPHPRNLTDRLAKKIAAKAGLIGLCFVSDFAGGKTINHLVKHFLHFKKIGLINHLAIGSDFGALEPAEKIINLGTPEKINNLQLAMTENGFSKKEVENIFWRNAFNFFKNQLQ